MTEAPVPSAAAIRRPWLLFFANLTLVYPLCMLATLYGAWLAGWLQLGRPPRAWIDDPKHVGGFATFLYHYFTVLLVGALPVMVLGSFANLGYVLANRRDPKVEIRGFLLAAFWGAAIFHLVSDPFDLMKWYMD